MSKVAKAAMGLMIATMIAKILGFAKEQVLSYVYGASMYTDIYITAMNIPIVIFSTIGTALLTTFIPLYCDINNEEGEKNALQFTNNVFSIVIILCIILAILGILFTEPLVKLFAIGFKGESLKIAIDFTRILIMGIVFIGLANIMTAYLQVKNNFFIPGLVTLPQNIIVIISMILSIKWGPYIMVWGTLIGMGSQFLFQLPFAYKEGYRYKRYINLNDKYIKKMLCLVGPVFIGVAVNQVNAMIDRTLASTLVEGSISALNYANKLNGFVLAMFIVSIASVVYPMFSKLSSGENMIKFKEAIVNSVNSVVLLVIPISVGAIILSTPIVEVLFERGAFDSQATAMTSSALSMYAIGMIGFGLIDILGKVFYSLQDTKTPMLNGAITMGINIILNLLLVKFMGHSGLALATSISVIVGGILLLNSLRKKIGNYGQMKIFITLIKVLFAAVIMGIISKFSYKYLYKFLGKLLIFKVVALGIGILIGALVYVIIIVLLRIPEVDLILKKFKKRK